LPRSTPFPYTTLFRSLGCTFFDTAAVYVNGKSEETLGASISKVKARDKVTVVTKGHPSAAEKLAAAVDESLGRLKFDMVDIYYRSEEHTSELQSLTNL